ncbi:hypothetical protein OsccyDRAFT_4577 [Leptolyngbyaceae cyanobacterium JSC-12]|nr:hypothetical protein OsccyDRAFT_4577 [Leptolyngbyaceae cyanobacterium JSC-12]
MPQLPKTKRSPYLRASPEHYERVKQAQAELAQKIDPFASLIWLRLFILLIIIPIVISVLLVRVGMLFSRVYAMVVGSLIIWSSILSLLNGQPSFTYIAGSANPLPFFQFNPGLGNVYFGWGVILSVKIGWEKAQGERPFLILAFILGLATCIVGLMNLRGIQVDIAIRISGLFGLLLALLVGFAIVATVLTPWQPRARS